MDVAAELGRARELYGSRLAWADAFDAFAELDAAVPLDPPDLERWAETAYGVGRGDVAVRALQRAYQSYADVGDVPSACRCAFWLQHALGFMGDFAQASGWVSRATRLLQSQPDCAHRAYLLLPEAHLADEQHEHARQLEIATEAAELGRRCGDVDVVTVATGLQGRALVRLGRVDEGLALLDEAMVAITADETSPRVTGWMYCATIATCQELQELRRAREWSAALRAWTDAAPQFTGAFSGVCRIHRSELFQMTGEWPVAVREAELACDLLTRGWGEIVAGGAFYQLAEIHRLRGDAEQAEEAYRAASRYGHDAQPGLALLRLDQGRADASAAAIRRLLAETSDELHRARLLPPYVDIMIAVSDRAAAREAATELAEIAETYRTTALAARSEGARGAVHLSEGSPQAALPALRRAWRLWQDLDAPYEAARVRVLVGQACRAVHDEDSAAMELDAARLVFEQLGAEPDLARLEALAPTVPQGNAGGLSPRELDVIRLVAAGRSNAAIAAELFLSEKTVARHLSNIFGKLGVGSRTAAAAYAYEHDLV
jgi:ATP/maltotriose-dependent transcriptional regulator MalT